jgi:hypothetical protein
VERISEQATQAVTTGRDEPFHDFTHYRALTAYVYGLEGSRQALHASSDLPVPLEAARRVLHERRQHSLGRRDALPFLRAAPSLKMQGNGIAILEVLDLVRHCELFSQWWGNPLPIGMLSWVLREDRRLVRGRVDGPLSKWALVSVASESEGVSVAMTDEGCTLFRTERDGATEWAAGGHSPRVEGCDSGREEDAMQWAIPHTSDLLPENGSRLYVSQVLQPNLTRYEKDPTHPHPDYRQAPHR